MDKGISETVSEKRGRGRPPVFNSATLEQMRREPLFRGRSTRTLQNDLYQGRAQQLVDRPEHEPWVRWLIDHEGTHAGKPGSIKLGILSQLGRIDDDAHLVAVARRLCEFKPTPRQVVAMIRWLRKVQKPVDLTDTLRRTLNTYLRDHPELTLAQARDAVAYL